MSFMMHCGAEAIDVQMLAQLETPPATQTHHPISHREVVEMVKYSLGYYGHEITEEHHFIAEEGARYFGALSLRSPHGDYTDLVALRNSHDKKFPIGIAVGARVFVCDNLSFVGDHVVKRRHTPRAKRDLPGLVATIVEPLHQERQAQHEKFQTYQNVALTDEQVDHMVLELYRRGVLNIQRVPQVLSQWKNPTHDWGPPTAWRLFNAVTLALTGRMAEKPEASEKLHELMDAVTS